MHLERWFAFNRTVGVVLASVLLFGLGEELWRPFVPVYLKAQTKGLAVEAVDLGAITPAALWFVGAFACCLNLFEGFCFLGGGQITAKLGDRGSLLLFGLFTIFGYSLFLLVPTPLAAVIATLFILGWEPLSVPVTFTTVGATVANEKRGIAFAWQSVQKRLPRLIGPVIAGYVLDYAVSISDTPERGQIRGMEMLVGISLVLAIGTFLLQWRFMPHRPIDAAPIGWRELWGRFPRPLRRLLLAEVFTRWCDWLVRDFVVLYVVFVKGATFREAGLLLGLQHLTALATYLPIGRMTQVVGLQPFIGLTFVFFALFPLALVLAPDHLLWLAFVINGLREIGEPARKAMITGQLPGSIRARGVGLYWGSRSFAICWASLAGAGLWLGLGPTGLLLAAFAFGVVGAAVYFFGVGRRLSLPPNGTGTSG